MTYDVWTLAEAINEKTDITVIVTEVWIDLGAEWMDKTVVSIAPKEYQVLSPRDVQKAKAGIMTEEEAQAVIDEINRRGW